MEILEIRHVKSRTVAFTIYDQLYYLKTGPDLPELYDSKMNRMMMPNVDSWLQAQTHQRYSLRGLKDMMNAFSQGVGQGFSSVDIEEIIKEAFDDIERMIFRTEYSRYYSIAYRLEMMDPKHMERLINQIRMNFDDYLAKFGDDRLYNYLCRVLKFCNNHMLDESSTVERLISRLGRKSDEPKFPVVEKSDEIKNKVLKKILNRLRKDDNEIIRNVELIHDGL